MQKIFYRQLVTLIFLWLPVFGFSQVGEYTLKFEKFEVYKKDTRVILEWTVAKESNYFEIEKSADGKNFKTIMYVMGANPAAKEENQFEGKLQVTKQKMYYRLKHIGTDGMISYSAIKSPGI